jgi:triphosphoribosyl-dephospho-CoA synthase CitG
MRQAETLAPVASKSHIISYIGYSAYAALIEEVSTTPKPGLVDQHNSGSHSDMDYACFVRSANALSPYFTEMVSIGYHWCRNLEDLFLAIRPIGMEAEKAMLSVTNSVNTHRGAIFSLGLMCAASAYVHAQWRHFDIARIFSTCIDMTQHILQSELLELETMRPRTHGENVYRKDGSKGVRGEAMTGFPSVRDVALPLMVSYMAGGYQQNLCNVQVLLHLMTVVDDSNVLARHDRNTLESIHAMAKDILEIGGCFTQAGMESVQSLDAYCIARHISCGGCADLLALTIFLAKLLLYDEP